MKALWQLTAAQLADGFRAAAFTPEQALAACLARTAEVNPRLNALVALDAEGAAEAAAQSTARWRSGRALGALDGVPATIKDNLQVRGLPTHWGSRALAGFVAERDELPVARLREAGAVIFGKTNVPEFTMQGYTGNPVFGPTGNPWNPALTPGGSSGGAVALVAAGGCPVALGTDGGGSIRRPASHTNLVGLKPSRGRVRRGDGLPPIFLDFEVVGPMARCVDDVAAVMQAIAPRTTTGAPHEAATPQPARILYLPRFADHPVDPRIARLVDAAAGNLAALGHQVTTLPRFELAEAVNQRWPLLAQVGLAWLVDHPRELWPRPFDPALFGPAMQANTETGRNASARALFELLFEAERLRGELAGLFEQHDFLLTPATAALPWPAADTHPPRIDGREVGPRGHAVFAGFVNAVGLPAIALPCGFAEGLPVGLQLVAREGGDDALLALAREFERAHPWQRFPAL
ncbi:amidase [Variovorax paradoxus]|uniref:amidase n=1 Tax=Variovorax paradoxus TaxID=34073 RepID=UPI00278886FA|nr:amidase [Variovorax paradoxus]MDQ0588552.1 aspartyl-tRNA(Asn)/glutamyl-tRNA(Gln) amidotransferase subunit A [Variovorax paradoxus]